MDPHNTPASKLLETEKLMAKLIPDMCPRSMCRFKSKCKANMARHMAMVHNEGRAFRLFQ